MPKPWRKRREVARSYFLADRGIGFGKKASRAATFCGFASYASIATRMRCWRGSSPLGRGCVTRAIEVASTDSWMEIARWLLRSEHLSLKRFTGRRRHDDPAQTWHSQRKLAGGHA